MTHFRTPSADHARELVIEVKTTFRGPLAEKIESEAQRLGVKPVNLLADLVTTIFNDNLTNAVLDR